MLASGFFTLVCILLALFFNNPIPLLLPIGLAGSMLVIAHFKGLYFLLMSLLVLSIDLELPNGLGLDFPSEPLMLVFTLAGLLFFIPNSKQLKKPFFNHPIFLWLLAHFVWIGVSCIFSSYFMLSFKFLLAKTWYIVTFTIVGGLFIKEKKDVEQVFWYMLIPMMLVILWVLARFISYGFDFEFVNKTMNPIYVNHVDYGVALAIFMPFCLWFRNWYKTGKIAKLTIDIGIVLIFLGIVFSYTRAAYISLILIPICWFVFRYKLTKLGIVLALLVASAGIFYLSEDNKYVDYAPDYDTTIFHTDFSDHLGATVAMKDLSTMERVYRWVAGARMWQEHPYLGFGPSTFTSHYRQYASGLFRTYVSANEENSTTHNYFLMTLVEQGVLGFLIFLALCLSVFIYGEKVYHRLENKDDKAIVMATLISALLIVANILMADLIETDEIGTMFFLYIAIIINFDLKSKENKMISN